MDNVNVMVFPCGSEVGLELHRSLKDIRFVTLYGASGVDDHGKWVYKNYIGGVPFITDPSFVDALNEAIDRYDIDYIFPALDSVIVALTERADELHAKLLTAPERAALICRSKLKTYAALDGCGFLPRTYSSPDAVDEYPVIIKPSESQGAQGFMVLEDRAALEHELSVRTAPQVVCEYLPGAEYTVDCFTDRHGVLRFFAQRCRGRIKSGISVNSRLLPEDPRVRDIAMEINSRLGMRGVWFFQLKEDKNGNYKLLECATRVAGTMCLSRASGVNLPLLTLFDAMGYDLESEPRIAGVEVDRALHASFKLDIDYDEAYIDYDDTLIVHDRINFTVLRFVYQCVQNGVRVVLLTRHDTDVRDDLKAHRIAPELFDEIVCIPRSERKIDHVNPSKHALFIDDSFAERRAMRERFGITALGVDAAEALVDDRE